VREEHGVATQRERSDVTGDRDQADDRVVTEPHAGERKLRVEQLRQRADPTEIAFEGRICGETFNCV